MKFHALIAVGSIALAASFTAPEAITRTPSSLNLSSEPSTLSSSSLTIPLTYNEMIVQTSAAMSDAYNQGYKRQIVRILLPRDARSGQLGEYYENEAQTEKGKSAEMMLVPTDESWQGGIMQVYKYFENHFILLQYHVHKHHVLVSIHIY